MLTRTEQEILDMCPQKGVWFRAGTHRSAMRGLSYTLSRLWQKGVLERSDLKSRGHFHYYLYTRVVRVEYADMDCPTCKGRAGIWVVKVDEERNRTVNVWTVCGACNGRGHFRQKVSG